MHVATAAFVGGVVAGIIVGFHSPFASEIAVTALALSLFQWMLHMSTRKCETKGLALSLYTALFSLALFAGVLRVQLVGEKHPYVCGASCSAVGTLVSSPESRDAYQTFVFRPDEGGDDAYDVLVRVPLYPQYELGERVAVSGTIREPETMFPHEGERSFDYIGYLHEKGIGSESLFPRVESFGGGEETISVVLGKWKGTLVEKLNAYVSSPANSLASGMLFGDASMSNELKDMFRTAGLSHIIVLSGFNIALVIAFVLFVFRFLPLVLRVMLASAAVVMFVMMVGGEASVIRATLMAFVSLLALLTGREYVARQALLLSFLAIILYDPAALTDNVSLHLSFLATAGIVYWSESLQIMIKRWIRRPFIVELLTTTLAAYVATLPYVMHTFGTVSVYALLANVIVLPLVPLAMLLSFLTLVVSFVSSSTALLVGFADSVLISIILRVAEMISVMPGARTAVPLSLPLMYETYFVLVMLIHYLSKRASNETLRTTEEGYLTGIISY